MGIYYIMAYNLDTGLQSMTIYLDSANCIARSPSFKYSLASVINTPLAIRMLIGVQSVSLPNVINNINEYNNKFKYRLRGINYTITIPVGIYSAWSFKDYLNTRLLGDLTITYSNMTFRYSFYATEEFSILEQTTCGGIIGVSKNAVNDFIYPVSSGVPAYSLTMPSTVNFIYTPYISLRLENIAVSNINSTGVINGTFVRIPINCQYGEIIQYRPTELNRFLIGRNDIDTFEISLFDSQGRVLPLPSGVELQVIIKIDFINKPTFINYEDGTISKFYKDNPVPDADEEADQPLGT